MSLNKNSLQVASFTNIKDTKKDVRKPITKSEMEEYNKKFHKSDAFLGTSVLTWPNLLSAMRENMFIQQIPQFQMILNPEIPRVRTGYEHEVGKYSKSYYKADRNWKVIDRITKYPKMPQLNYFLIVVDEVGNYDIIERHNHMKLSEQYGYKVNNEVLDSKNNTNNSVIYKDEILYKSTAFDENMNYGYGVNGRCLYMSGTTQTEDQLSIRQSFANKLTHPVITEVQAIVNMNHVPLNTYGDDEMYQSFPNTGQKIVNSILFAKRSINKQTMLHALQNKNLKYIHDDDDDEVYYADGYVVDVEIFLNKRLDEIKENNSNSQLLWYYKNQQEYWKTVKKKLGKIISENPTSVSDRLLHKFHRAEDLTSNKLIVDKNSKFEYMMVKFTVYNEQPVRIGYKLTGRSGEKGVIGTIIPDDEMPRNQYGEIVDIICSPKGAFGRLNASQLMANDISFIADNIVRDLKTHEIPAPIGMVKIIEFAYDLDDNYGKKLEEFVKNISDAQLIDFYNDILTNGLSVEIPPFWNKMGIDGIRKLYHKYKYPRYKMYKNGERIIKRQTVGIKYVLALKQTTKSKYSARGLGMNSAVGHPSKSIRYKRKTLDYSDTPIKLGEMEIMNLLMMNDPEEISKFLKTYATSPKDLETMVTQIMTTPNPFGVKIEIGDETSINRKILNAYSKACGGGFEDI